MMKPGEIVTEDMIEKAARASKDVMPYSGANARMRAALIAVAPLFAEKFAKIADEQSAEFRKRHVIAHDPNQMAAGAESVARAIRATKEAARD